MGQEKKNPGKVHKAPWVEEMNANSWEKPRQLEFTRQHAKRESNTRTELWDLLRILSDIQLSTYQHIYVENYQSQERTTQRISGNSAQHLHRGHGILPVLTSQTGTPHNLQGVGKNFQKASTSEGGTPEWALLWVPPNKTRKQDQKGSDCFQVT